MLFTAVGTGSLAEAAGLRAGDLLVAANGRELHDGAQLELGLRTLAPGQALVLQLQREGQVLERTLRRATAP